MQMAAKCRLKVVFSSDTFCQLTNNSAIAGVAPCSMLPCAMAGDLVLTEFMANPNDVADTEGEYIEIYNRSDDTFNLFNYTISDNGTQSITISSSLVIFPGEFVVLGNNSSIPEVDYVYTSDANEFSIGNGNDEVFLRCPSDLGPILVTGVDYTNGDPFGAGVALELNCLDNPGPTYDEDDFVAATDDLNYDADGDLDMGSPGAFGNTDTVTIIPIQLQTTFAPDVVSSGISFNIEICATDAMGMSPCVYTDYIVLEQIDGVMATITNDSLPPDNACATFEITVPMITECDTIEFDAHADALNLDMTISIIVKEIVHFEPFTCDMLTWSVENVDSFSTWECDTTGGFVDINTFGDDTSTVSDDWIISPSLDLTTHRELSAHFETRERFDGPPLEFLYSTDYSGVGDPNAATWTSLPFAFDNSQNGFAFGPWTSSGDIDINALSSPAIFFAMKYSAFPNDSVSNWLVDNFVISGCPKNCAIDSITLTDISTCDPGTNQFTADVTVHYQDAPSTGMLILGGDAADTILVSDMSFDPDGSMFVFDSVEFTADGGLKTVTATFTADPSCTLTVSDIAGTDVAPCADGATVFGGLVVNEVWNDGSFGGATCFSNQAFIEMLVVASIDEDTTSQLVNLQNWIIDPSNDAFDPGHIRIKTGCLTSVPVGALVVIYNEDNVPTGIAGPDEMDADSNLVYLIPSNSACLEFTTDASFPGGSYTDASADPCMVAGLLSAFASTIPYEVETRHPHSFLRTYTNVYDDLEFNPLDPFTPAGSSNFTCGNIDDAGSVIHDLATTPGLANNSDNESLINAVREEAGNVLPLSMAVTPNLDAIDYYQFLTPGLTPDCGMVVLPDCVDTLVIAGPVIVSDTFFCGGDDGDDRW